MLFTTVVVASVGWHTRTFVCVYGYPRVKLSTYLWSWSDPFITSRSCSLPVACFILTNLLFPQFHRVFFVFLVYDAYLDHAILIDVHVVTENDVGKVMKIVAPKYIERFSPMKPVLSS